MHHSLMDMHSFKLEIAALLSRYFTNKLVVQRSSTIPHTYTVKGPVKDGNIAKNKLQDGAHQSAPQKKL